jgi:hypothetical protein
MVYFTTYQSPSYRQMTLEDLLFGDSDMNLIINNNHTNTKTVLVENVPQKYLNKISVSYLINKLEEFNRSVESLRNIPRKELYRTFCIPKKSGGLRKISAPNDALLDALRRLKSILENDFNVLYHTSAFAYIKGRSTINAIERHQSNESKWFGKYDLSDFFGSTTLEFVISMFSKIFPFSEVVKYPKGLQHLRSALELAFLDGGLPQGTPISPIITNVMMIPIDHKLANTLREYKENQYVYTRYADDFLISSKYNFNPKDIETLIVNTLHEFGAPFTLKASKTRYGSSAGRNWNLGVMLNAENNITVGHQKKRQFKAMLTSYILDRKNGKKWTHEDLQTLMGLRSYYRMVEQATIDEIIDHINSKWNVDVCSLIKFDLKN